MKKLVLLFVLLIIFLPVTSYASVSLDMVNQKVCSRFDGDVVKLAAIMEELRIRKGITETRVAFGGVDTQIKSADYWITAVAEAIAFQRVQKFGSQNELRYSLETLKNKVLKAKTEVRKALNE